MQICYYILTVVNIGLRLKSGYIKSQSTLYTKSITRQLRFSPRRNKASLEYQFYRKFKSSRKYQKSYLEETAIFEVRSRKLNIVYMGLFRSIHIVYYVYVAQTNCIFNQLPEPNSLM